MRSGSVDLDRDAEARFFDGETQQSGSSTTGTTSTTGGVGQPPPGPGITSTRISRNPFLDNPDEECTRVLTEAEVYPTGSAKREANSSLTDLDPISSSTTNSAPVSALGSDLLPGIPRVPSNNTALLAPAQSEQSRDLLAITPTSGEALPMPSLEPTPQRRASDAEIYDDSDADSVATEGCDEMPDPEDYGGADYDYGSGDPSMLRSGSLGSDIGSWHSNLSSDSQLDDTARACRDFMKHFVNKIFSRSVSLVTCLVAATLAALSLSLSISISLSPSFCHSLSLSLSVTLSLCLSVCL